MPVRSALEVAQILKRQAANTQTATTADKAEQLNALKAKLSSLEQQNSSLKQHIGHTTPHITQPQQQPDDAELEGWGVTYGEYHVPRRGRGRGRGTYRGRVRGRGRGRGGWIGGTNDGYLTAGQPTLNDTPTPQSTEQAAPEQEQQQQVEGSEAGDENGHYEQSGVGGAEGDGWHGGGVYVEQQGAEYADDEDMEMAAE